METYLGQSSASLQITPFDLVSHVATAKYVCNQIYFGVKCSTRDSRFAGSNMAEVDGFFQDVKIPEHKSSRRDFRLWVLSLRFQAR